MKLFSAAALARLNAQHGGGAWVKSADVTRPDDTIMYLADTLDPFVFNSNVYQPRAMEWSGVEQSGQMTLPSVQVTTTNVDGAIDALMEGASMVGRPVILRLIHLDLLATPTDADSVALQVITVEWDRLSATFRCGINLGLSDQIPRHVMTRAEYPGIPDAFRRATIL